MKKSSSPLLIVPYQPVFASALSAMVCQNLTEVNSLDYPPEEIKALVASHQPDGIHALAGLGDTFAALRGETPVGMVTLASNQDEPAGVWYLRNFFVSPALHRQGIGTQLLRYAEKEALTRRASLLALYASRTARNFYLSQGFLPAAQQEDENGLLRMEKQLHPMENG